MFCLPNKAITEESPVEEIVFRPKNMAKLRDVLVTEESQK